MGRKGERTVSVLPFRSLVLFPASQDGTEVFGTRKLKAVRKGYTLHKGTEDPYHHISSIKWEPVLEVAKAEFVTRRGGLAEGPVSTLDFGWAFGQIILHS